MSKEAKIPEGILCASTHEWVLESDDIYTIGLTDLGITELGEIVSIDLPEIGSVFLKNEVFGTIESVKEAAELYMPIGGQVIEVNEELLNTPDILNEDSYEKGWFIKISSNTAQEDSMGLLEYEDYREELE